MKIRLIIFKLKREQNVLNNKLICVVKRLLNSMWRARSNVVTDMSLGAEKTCELLR